VHRSLSIHELHLQKGWQLGIVLHSKKLDSEAAGGAAGQEPSREVAFCLRTPALLRVILQLRMYFSGCRSVVERPGCQSGRRAGATPDRSVVNAHRPPKLIEPQSSAEESDEGVIVQEEILDAGSYGETQGCGRLNMTVAGDIFQECERHFSASNFQKRWQMKSGFCWRWGSLCSAPRFRSSRQFKSCQWIITGSS
jgi:hypothetical protein